MTKKYVYVVDLDKCMGCNACVVSCKIENNTGEGIFWMQLFKLEKGEYPNVQIIYLPIPCMHCDNAPCVKVCPVGARYKREDGLVLTDYERCIGCRYCEIACPYGVNFFNWKDPNKNQYYDWEKEGKDVYGSGSIKDYVKEIPPYKNPDLEKYYGEEKKLVAGSGHFKGVIEKCTWCVHRIEKGLKPSCVENCPVNALLFGNIEDPNSEVSKILRKKKAFRLLEEIGTKPRVYYVGGSPPGTGIRLLSIKVKK